jgi:hypothetical protein
LVLLVTAIAISLGWWLRPYTVERIEDGRSITGAYRLRRGLLGGEVAHGLQSQRMFNGQVVRWMQWGDAPDPDGPAAHAHEYLLTDGSRVDRAAWETAYHRGIVEAIDAAEPDFDQLIDLIQPLFTREQREQMAAALAAQDAAELVEPCEQ